MTQPAYHEKIAEVAYDLWKKDECPDNKEKHYWHMGENIWCKPTPDEYLKLSYLARNIFKSDISTCGPDNTIGSAVMKYAHSYNAFLLCNEFGIYDYDTSELITFCHPKWRLMVGFEQ